MCSQGGSRIAIITVGDKRSESHERTATGVVDTVTERNGTVGDPGATWADVVRKLAVASKPAVARNAKKVSAILSKGTAGIDKRTQNAFVLQRSFSQNNPVNRFKV